MSDTTDKSSVRRALFAEGNLIGGQYRIRRELSAGGMGVTYIARDERLDRDVVLKTVRSHIIKNKGDRMSFLERFRQEAVLAANLSHRAIIPIFQFGEEEGICWYAMELIEGGKPLSDLITEASDSEGGNGYVNLDDVRAYFMDAAAGLRAIHDLGAIHRDIKTENLLCFRTGEGPALKILDFGVAHSPKQELTLTGYGLGTPTYLAPEYLTALASGRKPDIDGRLDLFALGVTLYRTLTGDSKPFSGSDFVSVAESMMSETPAFPSELRPGLGQGWDAITMRLLAKNPDNRYQTAGDVYAALKEVDSLPAYQPPEDDAVVPLGEATNPGRPASKLEMDWLADMDEHGGLSGQGDPTRKQRRTKAIPEDREPSLELRGLAAEYAEGASGSKLSTLPKPARWGLLLAVFVVGALAALLLIKATGSNPDAVAEPLLDPNEARAEPKNITAEDLLREQNEARYARLLAESRAADQAKPAEEPEETTPTKRRRKRRAALPGATATPPPAPAPPEPANEPRRKTGTVVTFYQGPDGEGGAAGNRRLGIPTGYKTSARLESLIASTAPNTMVTAVLPAGVRFADVGEVLPKGTKAVGKATFRPGGSAERVTVRFTRLVFPDRTERKFDGVAVSSDGHAGLPASVRRPDRRSEANAAEGALDAIDGAVGALPGGSAVGRYSKDARDDARGLRRANEIISVPAGTTFKIQFTKPL